jgi:hypothetical protein
MTGGVSSSSDELELLDDELLDDELLLELLIFRARLLLVSSGWFTTASGSGRFTTASDSGWFSCSGELSSTLLTRLTVRLSGSG